MIVVLSLSYGLITLASLWTGAGALAEPLAQRALPGAFIHVVIAALTCFFYRGEMVKVSTIIAPLNWFSKIKRPALTYFALILLALGLFFTHKINPEYFAAQSLSLNSLSLLSGFGLVVSFATSAYCYHRFFSPAWGVSSAAFLEALTWGLALQSFVGFLLFYISGYVFAKNSTPQNAFGAALIRTILGITWILVS